jgi:hypothetical protein
MYNFIYYLTTLLFIIIVILSLRKTDNEKIDAITTFFIAVNPYKKIIV